MASPSYAAVVARNDGADTNPDPVSTRQQEELEQGATRPFRQAVEAHVRHCEIDPTK
jgi:hypothetical protein